MQKLAECDHDAMFGLLYDVGVNMAALQKKNPSVQRMRELYAALLYLQLAAWKEGTNPREIVKTFNKSLAGKPIQHTSKRPVSSRSLL
jgi:hypothetical protein